MNEPVSCERTVFAFESGAELGRWRGVNDRVMGGLSEGSLARSATGIAVFAGTVSLRNFGGFASVYTVPHDDRLGGYRSLVLRVRGDGKRYKLRLRTSEHFDDMAYQADFDTWPGEWITVRVSFDDMVPTFRGRRVPGVPDLDPAQVRQIGLMIADKQAGPFQLEIDWIRACP